jgi:hypothetical protein
VGWVDTHGMICRSSCRVLIRGKIIIEAIWAEVVR